MNVCLVNAAPDFKSVRLNNGVPILALSYLGASLKQASFQVLIIDAYANSLDNDTVVENILKADIKLIGLSCLQYNAENTFSIIKMLREKGYEGHITIGGHFPSFNHEQIFQFYGELLDSICVGEGEISIVELAKKVQNNENYDYISGIATESVYNSAQPLIETLDNIPYPLRYHEVSKPFNYVTMLTSRGCYGLCTYCGIQAFYGLSVNHQGNRWRAHSEKRVVNEIDYLIGLYKKNRNGSTGSLFIEFVDDNFIGSSRERAFGIAEEILSRGYDIRFAISCRPNDIETNLFKMLKKAGLQKVFIGIEFWDDKMLKTYKRNITISDNEKAIRILKELELDIEYGFMGIHPYTSYEELKNNHNAVKMLGYEKFPNKLGQLALNRGSAIEKSFIGKKYGFTINEFVTRQVGIIWAFDYDIKDKLVNKIKHMLNMHNEEMSKVFGIIEKIAEEHQVNLTYFKKFVSLRTEQLLDELFEKNDINESIIENIYTKDIKSVWDAVHKIQDYYTNKGSNRKIVKIGKQEFVLLKTGFIPNIFGTS